VEYILILAVSYIAGSIPSGYIVGKVFGIDIRQLGSNNIGATNVYRVLGFKPALAVFIADAVKGMAGVYAGHVVLGTPLASLAGGFGAIAGHNWSLFLGFKGGRGVATTLGVLIMLMPKESLVLFLLWAVIVYITRIVSFGSIVAALVAPFLIWYFGERIELLYFGIVAAAFVIVRHKQNIIRLLKGEEQKIKAGKPAAEDKKGK